MVKKIILVFLLSANVIFSQSINNGIKIKFFPQGLNFMPLKASVYEPKMGVWYHTKSTNLKVDIGNSTDLIGFLIDETSVITTGIDFWGYALTTSYAGNRLQIDALDGFFGGNISYSRKNVNSKNEIRFRIIHNSAHLVDGHYDKEKRKWIKQDPIPYTRDFGELTFAQRRYISKLSLRYYASLLYATLVRPNNLKKVAYNCGLEIFEEATNAFIAFDLRLNGIPEYIASGNLMAGIKFGNQEGKGIIFYLSYYKGLNMFSEYYSEKISKFGIGFSVDFF